MDFGLAMYTVHKSAGKDLSGTCERLAETGYRGVEFFGDMIWDPNEIAYAISSSGLAFTGWHIEWRDLQENRIDETIAYLQKSGCSIAVIPCLGGHWQIGHTQEEECRDVWLSHLEKMVKIQAKLAENGIRCGYHNHAHEFQLSYDGKSLFEFIFDNLPDDMIIEFDSGNCIEGGADPLQILKKYRDRDMILHMKPFSLRRSFDLVLGDEDDENDWKKILDPKTKRYLFRLVESESTSLDEFENAKQCLKRAQELTKEL